MSNMLSTLFCLTFACYALGHEVNVVNKQDEGVSVNVTVMTWNILAPIWVNRTYEKKIGVDLNLLDWDIRLKLITMEIFERNPDILALQEVQEDFLYDISKSIKRRYKAIAFVPNKVGFWKSYLPEGVDYVKNGVATFYNSKKFGRVSHNSFKTSINGSFALTSVLYPRVAQFRSGRLSGYGHPIVVINCHQQAGRTEADTDLRVTQAKVILQEANRMREKLSHETPGSLPSVIIAGDINSAHPRPGFTIFTDNGYLDALETVGGTISSIDHVFISADDARNGLIRVLSADRPDIFSDELTEDSYVKKLTNMTVSHLRQQKFEESAKILSTILKIRKDGEEYNTKHNRVRRTGSDHMLVIAKIQQRNRYCYFAEHLCWNDVFQQVIFP